MVRIAKERIGGRLRAAKRPLREYKFPRTIPRAGGSFLYDSSHRTRTAAARAGAALVKRWRGTKERGVLVKVETGVRPAPNPGLLSAAYNKPYGLYFRVVKK